MMRRFSKSYFQTLACAVAIGAAAGLSACSGSDDEPTPESVDRLSLRLNVTLSTVGADASRADNGPDDFEPLPAGDFEQMATLRVLLLAPDGITVRGNRMVQMQLVDGNYVPLHDNLEFPAESNERIYVYLIANEASLPLPAGVTNQPTVSQWFDSFVVNEEYENLRAALDAWTAGYSSSAVSGSLFATPGSHLPMTERFRLLTDKSKAKAVGESGSADNGTLVVEYRQEATLFITPAAAKATFAFDFTDYKGSGVNVTGVRFSGLGRREYVFPNTTVYSPAKYTEAGEQGGTVNIADNRFITSFAVPQTGNGTTTFTFAGESFTPVAMQASTAKTVRGPIYFPETISTAAAEAFKVEVQLDGQTWLTAQPLTDNILQVGGFEAIARSTHLRINISFTEVGITWEAIEAPYNSVSLTPSFGDPYIPPQTGN